jgi:dipeptidyl aminopeptidase/acylaminoacyl peptidase
MKRFLVFFVYLFLPTIANAADKRPMTIDDLLAFKRVSDPQISPDGKLVAYVVGEVDKEANKIPSSIWLAATDGKSEPKRLTNAAGKKDSHPRWRPDGKSILFQSNRSGENQLWLIGVDGGEAVQLTTFSTGASDAVWSRDGKQVAFVSAVYPEYSEKPFKESDALNKKRKEEIEKNPVKAKVFTKLFYRHWDEYVEDKRQHLFVMAFNDGKGGEPKDVTPGDRDAFPTSDTFSTGDNFTFSPDGKYLVFTAVPEKDEAWSTNYDICRVPVNPEASRGRKPTEWECLTKDNPAADSGPVFSRDGKKLAYRAQQRAGFEADKWNVFVVACDESGSLQGKPANVTSKESKSVDVFVWGRGDKRVIYIVDDKGATKLVDRAIGEPEKEPLTVGAFGYLGGQFTSVTYSPSNNIIAFTRAYLNQPPEVGAANLYGGERRIEGGQKEFHGISNANDALLSELDLPRPESVVVPVERAGMQMWILKPPGFDPKKKWPLAFLVHGGPQGAWEDGWSYRWNPELWAAQGYVVALPNPRGSTGFGQKYIDEISGDWGGKCYDDLMAGLAYMEKQDYIDKDRMAAAGASFGGYMMNWFAVSNNKFKCIISHDGVWNFESMYATTDEVWFDEWEHGGPPWGGNRESYEKFSPHRKAANLGKFKTPMLIFQNDLDFRCPVSQGQELFTALQRQGVPSKFIDFPDEGHWVLKPKNSEFWHKEVFGWLKKHCPPGGQ